MLPITNTYNMYPKQNRLRLLMLVWMLGAAFVAHAQNLNKPNKEGPLGTQVNTLSGNLYIPRTDIYIPARGFNISISFYYNSYNFDKNTGFGNGWSFAYNIKLKDDTANSRTVLWGDGREDIFAAISGGAYKSPRGFFNTLSQYQPNKYLITETDGTKYYFDNNTHRKITRMEEPNGNFINFFYTDSLLSSLVNKAGQSISFTYNASGRLSSVVDAIDVPVRTFNYAYDGNNNLTTVTDPLGGTIKYTYLVNGPMKSLGDKNSNIVDIIYYNDFSVSELIGCNKRVSFSYDDVSNVTVVTDHLENGNNQITKYKYQLFDNLAWLTSISGNCCGFNNTYEFDNNGNRIKETDGNGQVYNYTYDSRGNLLTITDPLNRVTSYTYSPSFNDITSVTDPSGNVFTMSYDSRGNLVQITEPGNHIYTAAYNANGDMVSVTDPKGLVHNYIYDSKGKPTSVTAPNGYNVTFNNDARGNLLAYTDARGNTYNAEFDLLMRFKKFTDPKNNSVKLNYDAQGNITSVNNENNETSTINYDASNRAVKITDPLGHKTEIGYNAMDGITLVKDAAGNASAIGYDARNRIKSFTDATGNITNIGYDANGNVTNLSLPNGRQLYYTYDATNRLINFGDEKGLLGTITYDKNSNATSITNGTGATSTAVYDALDRMTKFTDPLGNSFTYGYDVNGNTTSVTDRNGFTRNYSYDSLNRVRLYTDNNGFPITVIYDASGNVAQVKDQKNNATTYTYDSLDHVKTVTYPDGKYLQFGYDKKGNATSKRLADGSTISYQYDSMNRIVSRMLPDGKSNNYKYDALGRITEATNESGTVFLTYDALSRLSAESFGGLTTRYSYNISGRTQTIIYPDSTIITKNYDTRGRLTGISKNNNSLVSYQYNNANQPVVKSFSNGVITNYQYDFANRLNTLTTAGGSIQNSGYTYDKERNKTAINRLNNPGLSEQFIYDNGYRLSNYKRGIIGGAPYIQNTYSYDAVGNRTAANLNGTNTTYTSNNINQLTSSNNGVQNIAFTFDNNGNLTFDGRFYKTYDAEGRLLKDSASASNVIVYSYDAFGRRVQKIAGVNATKFVYSGLAPIEERDVFTNAIINRTIFTSFLSPLVNEKNNNQYFYHQNELNSVEAITNSAGNLVESYQYDVYGKPAIYNGSGSLINASLTGNRFGLSGQEYDTATASYRFHFRNYSTATGTFNQRDLIGYSDGMGMYQYVGNNPANGIDILGLDDCQPKDKLTFEKIAIPQSLHVGITQLFLDEAGNVSFVMSLSEVPGQLYHAQYLKAASNYAKLGEAAFNGKGLKLTGQLLSKAGPSLSGLGKVSGALGKAGPVFAGADLAVKAHNYDRVLNDPASSYNDVLDAEADVVGSGGNLIGALAVPAAVVGGSVAAVPAAIVIGTLTLGDAASTFITGKNFRQHAEGPVKATYDYFNKDADYSNWLKTFGLEDSEFLKNIYYSGKGETYLRTIHHQQPRIPDCPPPGGTQKPNPKGPGTPGSTTINQSRDPNEIVGTDGEPTKHWVSVKDRLPYSILYENDKSASAPAKVVRITSPIEPKQDPASFQLGSFGFNNQTFAVPPNTASYYNRLDCRDSLGLYVDITAGYDQLTNQAFWEFQSIDPLTLLPPPEPFRGFLKLQDSIRRLYGHGFVNFSIKPRQTAVTLDTIGARAAIVFDLNASLPTNIAKNTIDAFAPTSHLNVLPATSPNPVALSWGGADDVGGCGLKFYTLYVSLDGVNFNIISAYTTRTDTTFTGIPGTRYYFFVLATDSVGNTEILRPGDIQSTYISAALPVSWLYFNGKTINKDNLLEWATANEINNKEFRVERSLDGSSFTDIGAVAAAGNGTGTNTYLFTDYNIDKLNSQFMYYRLRQIDRNNNQKYSNIVRLAYNVKEKAKSIVYPNPTEGLITVTIGDIKLIGTKATLMDENGKVLQVVTINANSQSLDLNKYVNGVYYLRLSNKEVLRVIKLK